MTPLTIAIRSLNACRAAHKPTYVGLRLLLDSEKDSRRIEWAASVAERKAVSRTAWRYYSYRILKEIDDSGQPSYRDCSIGSPTTLLSEALILQRMANEPAFAVPDCVYSYRWPKSQHSSRNFQYYHHGYTRRNASITKFLRENADHVAVITDIKRFYPSVSWALLRPKIEGRVASVKNRADAKAISNFSYNLEPKSGKGIPIGPDAAHVLGNIILDGVDRTLYDRFGAAYFRYVDDIIILCHKNDRTGTLESVQEALKSVELESHDGKEDFVAADIWTAECPSVSRDRSHNTFESLIHDLCLYLVAWPKRLSLLQDQFKSEGFSLPFSRLVTQSQYGPFRRFARSFVRRGRLREIFKLLFSSEKRHLESARKIRDDNWSSLEQLVNGKNPINGMRRRWFVQQCRYRINRLLYLSNVDGYARLQSLVPPGAEFAEYRILLNALVSGDISEIVRLPGKVIATFAEIASEGKQPSAPKTWPNLTDRSVAESVTMFALYFGWKVPLAPQQQMYSGSRILLDVCSGQLADASGIESFSYLDELELLMRKVPQESLSRFTRTRFSDDEALGLEGLWLGGGYALS